MAEGQQDPLQDPSPDENGDVGARRSVSEAVRKAMLTGLGAFFLTEENARKFARDWKLPKDIATYLATQAAGAKDEILRVVTEEIRKFFESPVLRREVLRMVSSMSIEVRAEISLKPARRGKSVHPQVKVTGLKPRVGRRRDEDDDEGGD